MKRYSSAYILRNIALGDNFFKNLASDLYFLTTLSTHINITMNLNNKFSHTNRYQSPPSCYCITKF